MINYFHSYFSKRAIICYFVALIAVTAIWFEHSLPWYWFSLGIIEVLCFFCFSTSITRKYCIKNEKVFLKWAFGFTFILRLLWIFAFYAITNELWDTPWEQPIGTAMDSYAYFDEAEWLRELIKTGNVRHYIEYAKSGSISDVGYPVLLAMINTLTGGSIILTRIPNALFDALSVVLVYKIAKRVCNKEIAIMASVFTMLMPTMFFYAGVTMKESAMVMVSLWSIERGTYICAQDKIRIRAFLQFLITIACAYLFRSVLAWTLFLSLFVSLLLTSNRLMSTKSKFVYFVVIGIFILMVGGDIIMSQVEELTEDLAAAENNLAYRATREGGNSLVANLSKAVFAPLILTIPFPTMINVDYQQIQMLQNGGYFIKNFMSIFSILAIFIMLKNGEWKNAVMPLAFLAGYVIVLCFSSFAQSGRFHQPVVPIEFILGAYAISKMDRKYTNYVKIGSILSVVFCIGWNWFKLKGKGMI